MRRFALLSIGILVGVLGLAAVRMATAAPQPATHYHANWAVFVDGERLDLSGDRFMEEVSACYTGGGGIQPQQRTHMHDNDPDVVHVHDDGVTWGHLMANLRFSLGENYLILPVEKPLITDGERTLKFISDSVPALSPYNRVIRSTERLLISYGPESEEEVLATQFPEVATTAEEHNSLPDPAACQRHEELTLGVRIRHAFLGR